MNHRIPTLLSRAALAALLAVGASAFPASPTQPVEFGRWPSHVPQRTDSKHGRAIARIMNPNLLRGRVHEEVVAELVALGRDAAPTLFAYLTGTIEGPEPDYSEPPPDEVADPALLDRELPREDRLLLDALAALPPESVVPQVTSASLRSSVDVKLVGVRVLGIVGGTSAVDAWLDLLLSLPPEQLGRVYVQTPSETALVEILRRDLGALPLLTARVKEVDARLLPGIVRSVGGARIARGVDVLLALLGRDGDLDRVLLAQIARLAEDTLGTLSEDQLTWIRPFATDDDWLVRREALGALGRLHDFRSHELFFTLLADEQRLVAQTAGWSLRRITGQDFGADVDAWRAWFEQELGWFDDEGARWTRVLEDSDPGRVMEAVGHLTHHPLFRHEVCASLVPLLQHKSPVVVTGVIDVLGNLGSRAAVPALVALLAGHDESVRTSAWDALVKLTGEKLPKEAGAWSAYVAG
jgi:HEAT repeat protein